MLQALRDRPAVKPPTAAAMQTSRFGLLRKYFCDLLDDDVRRSFEASVNVLREHGATIVEVDIPHASLIGAVYIHIVFGDAAAYHEETLDSMPERYTPNVRLRLEMARYVTAADYVRALDGRRTLKRQVDSALEGVDALLLPTLPIVAPPIGAATVEVGSSREPVRNVMLRLTQLFNLTGHPAVTLPSGTSASGLPCGLQLAGQLGRTDALLYLARGVELALAQ